MNKKWVIIAVTLASWLALQGTASAHVVLHSTSSNKAGAVLHISPDDDPVAGQPSQLFFDLKDATPHNATLVVSGAGGYETSEPVFVNGATISATYTFPAQGTYHLALKAFGAEGAYIFAYDQAVTRGTLAGADTSQQHDWANAVFVAAACALAVVIIAGINNRRGIAAHSIFKR
ncbi:MAG TPA: hypothetical protein VLF62_04605 [Candidatus Saccharimonadales bacterium]|nr:hypothetical protein [Candidatus Saccharimonadales bacterium]